MKKYRFPTTTIDDVSELTTLLLVARGIEEADAQATFLAPNYETGRHDPFLMHDMEAAVERLQRAIATGEKIAIYADYDCDGIPGAVVLHDFLSAAGHTNFITQIPHRHYEGFGLSVAAVEKLAGEGVELIVTIDCGTADSAAATRAKELGVELIITDHHEPKETLPTAVAVVNPKIGDTYPFPHLCGAGVVFKLVEALLERGEYDVPPGHEKWWLDMVGLATVSDMVPLVDENRVFAHYGLQVLRKSRRPGLQHLLRKARANQQHLTEDDIGFTIGPRINAASRMDTPEDAFFMLSATAEGEAGSYVDHLERLNNERKGLVASMTKELKKRLAEMTEVPDVLVLGSPEWRPALVGLAANKLAEEYNRPVFLWGRDGNGAIKGSCRSDGNTSVIALMDAAHEAFIEHGGHHASGGFTVRDNAIHTLSEALNTAKAELGEAAAATEECVVDAYLDLTDIHNGLITTLRELSPFGTGNPKPLFAFRDVTPHDVKQFGKTKEHLKLTFSTDGREVEAIAFFATPESFQSIAAAGQPLTLIAHVEESFFMGRRQTRLRIVDILEK